MPSAISVMPIINRKLSASMTMLGLAWMNFARGSAASSITATATITAIYMIAI